MFTSNRTVLSGHGDTNVQEREFITAEFFGSIPGDTTRSLRVFTNNDGSRTGFGTTMFFVGKQANGSKFVDKRGGSKWDQPGDTGMLDWGMFAPNNVSGATGLDALKGGQSKWHGPGMSMARMLGSDPNQVAVAGRRVMVGWVSGLWQMQGLPQDLSIGNDGHLRQTFVPELQSLRIGAGVPLAGATTSDGRSRSRRRRNSTSSTSSTSSDNSDNSDNSDTSDYHSGVGVDIGQQAEVVAAIAGQLHGESGVKVLLGADGVATTVGVDFDRDLVFIDATKQGNTARRAGPLLGHRKGSADVVTLHLIVDHSVVVAIFNNRTSLTTLALPPSARHSNAVTFSAGDGDGGEKVKAIAWQLKTANPNSGLAFNSVADVVGRNARVREGKGDLNIDLPVWQVPKIHNAPICNRYPSPR
jgi:hypothetical protein